MTVCGATAHLHSYGRRVCVMPAGHSTEGWHESADHIRWATDQALAARQDA